MDWTISYTRSISLYLWFLPLNKDLWILYCVSHSAELLIHDSLCDFIYSSQTPMTWNLLIFGKVLVCTLPSSYPYIIRLVVLVFIGARFLILYVSGLILGQGWIFGFFYCPFMQSSRYQVLATLQVVSYWLVNTGVWLSWWILSTSFDSFNFLFSFVVNHHQ